MQTGRESDTDGIIAALQAGAASIDHLNHLSYQDSSTLGIANAVAALLPCPTFYANRKNYGPARRLIECGAPVALASGYDVRTSATQNMQTVIALACSEMGMTVEEAISAATINGAHAVRRGDEVGSIEWRKKADIVVLGVPDYREIAYHFGVNLVDTTIKNGRVVFHRAKVQWPAA